MVPVPEPAVAIVSGKSCLNVAVTDCDTFITGAHVPVPEQPAPLQPVNTKPVAAVAVSVTGVPSTSVALHDAPPAAVQLMPAGTDVTVPLPTVVALRVTSRLKVAVTVCAASIVTAHVPPGDAAHGPVHPANTDPGAAVAASVTVEPTAKPAVQLAPAAQAKPPASDVTAPLPTTDTVNGY